MGESMLKHPHVKATHPAIRWDSGTRTQFYIIETDLTLSEDDPAYDEKALGELHGAIVAYLTTYPRYSGYHLEPFRLR
jgi:hypothetical protein